MIGTIFRLRKLGRFKICIDTAPEKLEERNYVTMLILHLNK